MNVFINHIAVECDPDISLFTLLSQQDLIKPGIAVAIDNKVVKRDCWDSTIITNGINITVIHAVCGG